MRKRMIATALTTALVLTGCGPQVPDLSELDNNKAAEYIAGEVLKHDKKYEDAFDYDRSVLNPTPTPVPTQTPSPTASGSAKAASGTSGQGGDGTADGGSSGEETTLQQVSLSELMAVDGLQISFSSSSLKDSYGTGYESHQAKKGKKLLIVYFRLKNTTGKNKKVVLPKKSIRYSLTMGDTGVGQIQRTIASGDLQYFKQTIKAGKSRQGILIFEVDKDMRINGAVLHATKGTQQASVPLK